MIFSFYKNTEIILRYSQYNLIFLFPFHLLSIVILMIIKN